MDEAAKKLSGGWLSRLLAGDHQAFAEFVDKYKGLVFLCGRTMGLSENEAEDVASETFLAAYRGISRYRGQAELSTWLWRIAYCQAITYLRKKRKTKLLLAEPDEQIVYNKEQLPAAALQYKEKEKIVWQAVERLPKLWAIAVILFYREGKSIKKIAKIMKIRQNTVKTYLFRGRQKLKEILAPTLGDDFDVNG